MVTSGMSSAMPISSLKCTCTTLSSRRLQLGLGCSSFRRERRLLRNLGNSRIFIRSCSHSPFPKELLEAPWLHLDHQSVALSRPCSRACSVLAPTTQTLTSTKVCWADSSKLYLKQRFLNHNLGRWNRTCHGLKHSQNYRILCKNG